MSTAVQTFLFADLAGFTAMTEVHGDEFAADAVAEFCSGVRGLLGEYEAEEIKSIGDALMLRVPEPGNSIRVAIRIIDEVGRGHGALGVRIGLHTGPAVQRDGDWFGSAVNLAARVAADAQAGEILLTEATREASEQMLADMPVRALGPQGFKNVRDPVEVYSVDVLAQTNSSDLPVDPVCRMTVHPERAAEVRVHGNTEFHFCSSECAAIFDRHPESYGARPA